MRCIYKGFILSCLLFIFMPAGVLASDLTLETFLETVSQKSEDLRSIDLDIQSLKLEIQARDLELTTTFDVGLARFWDNRPSLSSNYQTSGKSVDMGLTKPFATGTNLSLLSGIETSEYQSSQSDEQNLLNWQFNLSQSLWQNRFGRQVTLRRQRDAHELKSRLLTLMLQRQEKLIEFELLYWDIVYARKELRIREENFVRSKRMLEWMQDRFDRQAAEQVDLLQVQSLHVTRELQLQLAQDQLQTAESKLKEDVLLDFEFHPAQEEFNKDRDLLSLPASLEFAPQTPIMVETLQQQAESDFLKATSDYEYDQLKPTLEIGYSYGQQGLSPSFSRARRQASSSDNDYHQIGIIFSMPLDFSLIASSRQSSELKAEAQSVRSNQTRRQSEVFWEDINRMISDQKKRVQTALTLARFNQEKTQEERSRLEKGRTTAFQSINFEQEAAESELLVLQLLKQLRRTEAQARLFVYKADFEK